MTQQLLLSERGCQAAKANRSGYFHTGRAGRRSYPMMETSSHDGRVLIISSLLWWRDFKLQKKHLNQLLSRKNKGSFALDCKACGDYIQPCVFLFFPSLVPWNIQPTSIICPTLHNEILQGFIYLHTCKIHYHDAQHHHNLHTGAQKPTYTLMSHLRDVQLYEEGKREEEKINHLKHQLLLKSYRKRRIYIRRNTFKEVWTFKARSKQAVHF